MTEHAGTSLAGLLAELLGRVGLLADSGAADLAVRHPQALAVVVTLDTEALLTRAAAAPYPAAWLSSFAQGLAAGLAPVSPVANTFADAAGQLVARMATPAFAEGVEAAGAPEPFVKLWADDLVATYWIARDDGDVMLTRAQVQRWGVTEDRVTSAARSLLYHKSRGGAEPVDGGFDAYKLGDGYDAARVTILEDLEWSRSRRGLWVAIPSNDTLLFCEPGTSLGAFEALTKALWTSAGLPLSPRVFRLEAGKVSVA